MKKVFVVGGGASGLIAAIFAARNNNDVTILERNKQCGKKILITGNGKCNYWNDDQSLKHYHSNSTNDLSKIMTSENETKILDFFSSIGIVPQIKNGYYYPYSNQSTSVQTALILEAQLQNVKIVNGSYVKNIKKENNKFIITTEEKVYEADKVIVSTGSKASPKTGSDGNGYSLVEKLGHTIIKPLPALVQLKSTGPFLKEWAGIRTNVNLKLYENNEYLKEETGEVQLTNYGISGICTMQLSGIVARGLYEGKNEIIKINFVPWLTNSSEEFIIWMSKRNDLVMNRIISELLDGILNYKLVNLLIAKSKVKNINWNNLSKVEQEVLSKNIIEFNLPITETLNFESAQVSSGGIPITELNIENFESKIVKDLYITGEILDVDGDCGGYNLGFAWTSGMIVGENIND